MPRVGDNVGYQGHVFVVVEADERKVSRVDIERTAPLEVTESSGPNEPAPGEPLQPEGPIEAAPQPDHP